MKVRQGFVSNSSSSSFVCDITGEAEELYDGYEDGFAGCVNGHTFMTDGFKEVEDWIEGVENGDVEIGDDDLDTADARSNVAEHICPICNGKAKPMIVKRLKGMMDSFNITAEDLQ